MSYFAGRPIEVTVADADLEGRPIEITEAVETLRDAGNTCLEFFGGISDASFILSQSPATTVFGDTSFCRAGRPLDAQSVLHLEYSYLPTLASDSAAAEMQAIRSQYETLPLSADVKGVDIVIVQIEAGLLFPDYGAYRLLPAAREFSGRLMRYIKAAGGIFPQSGDDGNTDAAVIEARVDGEVVAAAPRTGDATAFSLIFDVVPWFAPDPFLAGPPPMSLADANALEEYSAVYYLAQISGDNRFNATRSSSLPAATVSAFFA